jgi:fructokinase
MIVVAGEALIDLVPVRDQERRFDAMLGGASFNVAIGLTRLGQPASFLGRLGSDTFGRLLTAQLTAERVDLSMAAHATEATTLGVTTLDDGGKAEYAFYASDTADWQWTEAEVPRELPAQARALYAGGLALRILPGAGVLEALMRRTQLRGGALVCYDPNVRSGRGFVAAAERDRVERQLELAHVVKASDDDIALLYPGREYREVACEWQRKTQGLVIVTLGPKGAFAITPGMQEIMIPPVDAEVVDTIGAGDSFAAAMLDGLINELAPGAEDPEADLRQIADDTIRHLLKRATVSAAYTCGRAGAESPDARTLAELMRHAQRELPVVRGRVRMPLDDLGVLGRLVDRLHRHPAGSVQPEPDVPVAPPVVPERETPVPRVLQVQVHPHRHVTVQQ